MWIVFKDDLGEPVAINMDQAKYIKPWATSDGSVGTRIDSQIVKADFNMVMMFIPDARVLP